MVFCRLALRHLQPASGVCMNFETSTPPHPLLPTKLIHNSWGLMTIHIYIPSVFHISMWFACLRQRMRTTTSWLRHQPSLRSWTGWRWSVTCPRWSLSFCRTTRMPLTKTCSISCRWVSWFTCVIQELVNDWVLQYLFVSNVKMYTGICLCNVPFIQRTYK